jgi:hypothetical protein
MRNIFRVEEFFILLQVVAFDPRVTPPTRTDKGFPNVFMEGVVIMSNAVQTSKSQLRKYTA